MVSGWWFAVISGGDDGDVAKGATVVMETTMVGVWWWLGLQIGSKEFKLVLSSACVWLVEAQFVKQLKILIKGLTPLFMKVVFQSNFKSCCLEAINLKISRIFYFY